MIVPQESSRKGIRSRLLFWVNTVVAVGLIILLLLDYRREVRAHMLLMRGALNEEAQTLLPALAQLRLHGRDAIQNHIDIVCGQMRESTSPGHHIVVAWGDERIQAHAHHRQSTKLVRAIEKAARSSDDGALIVGSARDDEMIVYVSEQAAHVLRTARARALHRGLILVALVAAIALVVNLVLLRIVVRPIRALANTVRAIAEGELGAHAPESDTAELHTLALEINLMSDALRRSEEDRAREMSKAQDIQRQLCRIPENLPGLRIEHVFRPAAGVAGDYFDVLELPDGAWLICVADVIGHGIPAAMTASILKALLVAAVERLADPGRILEFVNEHFHQVSLPGDFATAVLIRWDPGSCSITIAGAGHDPGLYWTQGGSVEQVDASGIVIGFQEGAEWETATRSVRDGARLLVFTDGVTETRNGEGVLFGIESLTRLLDEHASEPGLALLARIEESLVRHRKGSEQRDDVTILLIEFGCDETDPRT